MIEQIYKTKAWGDQQAESIDYTVEQFRSQYKSESETNTDEPSPEVADIVEDLLATAPVRGNKDARFTIIEYTELLCPYCQRHSTNGTIQAVMDKYPGEVNSVSRHYIIHGQPAVELAAAMECIAELKPTVYYDAFEKAFEAYPVDLDTLKTIATDLGVKKADLEKCIDE
jgi:protein-disulfide isomerase